MLGAGEEEGRGGARKGSYQEGTQGPGASPAARSSLVERAGAGISFLLEVGAYLQAPPPPQVRRLSAGPQRGRSPEQVAVARRRAGRGGGGGLRCRFHLKDSACEHTQVTSPRPRSQAAPLLPLPATLPARGSHPLWVLVSLSCGTSCEGSADRFSWFWVWRPGPLSAHLGGGTHPSGVTALCEHTALDPLSFVGVCVSLCPGHTQELGHRSLRFTPRVC